MKDNKKLVGKTPRKAFSEILDKEEMKEYAEFYDGYSKELDEEVKKEIATKLRKAREAREISQAHVARKLNRSRQYIHQIESGQVKVSTPMLYKYVNAIGANVEIEIV